MRMCTAAAAVAQRSAEHVLVWACVCVYVRARATEPNRTEILPRSPPLPSPPPPPPPCFVAPACLMLVVFWGGGFMSKRGGQRERGGKGNMFPLSLFPRLFHTTTCTIYLSIHLIYTSWQDCG